MRRCTDSDNDSERASFGFAPAAAAAIVEAEPLSVVQESIGDGCNRREELSPGLGLCGKKLLQMPSITCSSSVLIKSGESRVHFSLGHCSLPDKK